MTFTAPSDGSLDGLPGGRGLNIAHEAVARHAATPRRDQVAMRFLRRGAPARELTYGQLAAASGRFAAGLRRLGVERGERVFTLAGRCPELTIAALGTLAAGAVVCPLFASFGPEPIRTRLVLGEGRVLVTTGGLRRRKVDGLDLPRLEHVIEIGEGFDTFLESSEPTFEIPPTDPEDPALLHFTSGTTGTPKGALHVHAAVVSHAFTGRRALDLRGGDVYWCTADPGWVTGISYGLIAPLVCGATVIVDEEDFDAERWYGILESEGVEVWYTAPTAIRMLRKAGDELARRHDLSRLRFLASVGEPLDAESVRWSREVLGRPFHDTWWQTETGAILIATSGVERLKPGSMGRPLGVEAAIVERRDGDVRLLGDNVTGELAIRRGWPSMFRAYLHAEERYRACFAGDWYLSGDLARRDADGDYWFVGRADDAIQSAGHLIGPAEVESVLLEHEAVAEAGVIGVPDEVAGERVKAFVSLKPGVAWDGALECAIRAHARRRLGPAVAPREIAVAKSLPRTRSGKILRRLLKARELGLPEGDLSTLEKDEDP